MYWDVGIDCDVFMGPLNLRENRPGIVFLFVRYDRIFSLICGRNRNHVALNLLSWTWWPCGEMRGICFCRYKSSLASC